MADQEFREKLSQQLDEMLSDIIIMPRELTDEQADAAMRATAVHLDIKGSQLTVNREKMKARYRALVKFIEEGR